MMMIITVIRRRNGINTIAAIAPVLRPPLSLSDGANLRKKVVVR